MLYPAVGLNSVGEEVRLVDAVELWGIETETETETQSNTTQAVCVLFMFHGMFLFVF